MITIVANGTPRAIDDGATIMTFLETLQWRPEWVVVEHNGTPVARPLFGAIFLKEGDRIEVVRAVAGGAR